MRCGAVSTRNWRRARGAAVERRRVVRQEDHLGRRNERGRCWSLPQRDGARRLERSSRHLWGVATERRTIEPARGFTPLVLRVGEANNAESWGRPEPFSKQLDCA